MSAPLKLGPCGVSLNARSVFANGVGALELVDGYDITTVPWGYTMTLPSTASVGGLATPGYFNSVGINRTDVTDSGWYLKSQVSLQPSRTGCAISRYFIVQIIGNFIGPVGSNPGSPAPGGLPTLGCYIYLGCTSPVSSGCTIVDLPIPSDLGIDPQYNSAFGGNTTLSLYALGIMGTTNFSVIPNVAIDLNTFVQNTTGYQGSGTGGTSALSSCGAGCSATANVTGGVITTISVTSGGGIPGNAPYMLPPLVTITDSGGPGTGATAVAVTNGAPDGNVTAINVTNGGSGYVSPVVTITTLRPVGPAMDMTTICDGSYGDPFGELDP